MLARLVRDCIAMAFTRASAPALLACTSMNRYGPNKSRYAIAYIKYIYIYTVHVHLVFRVRNYTYIRVTTLCVQYTPGTVYTSIDIDQI